MSECFYCEDGEKRKSLMIEICKLNYSTIYLNRNQKYPGRCVVKLNEHKTEYFQMTKEQRDGYFEELAATAKAIFELYHPDKINYATIVEPDDATLDSFREAMAPIYEEYSAKYATLLDAINTTLGK